MEFIGVIRGSESSPGVDNSRWVSLVREHPNLVPPEPREIINPFTRKLGTIRPRADVARVLVAGQQVGTMSWAEDGSDEINVFGDPPTMVPLAQEIAGALGCRFEAEVIS